MLKTMLFSHPSEVKNGASYRKGPAVKSQKERQLLMGRLRNHPYNSAVTSTGFSFYIHFISVLTEGKPSMHNTVTWKLM